ncbi:hypothetical protein AGR2A_pc0143 [Agrobacterium genomosp. 2 str. CFBP 5494]|uniref:Uncharacterized protein n=1 Tax=Agrobacterium genomosp. 2 str. CFBP 5494 TaxID=1183436 RepID=A0A9W5F412_9HYPH|nr:hypothetical protein AGR2A_pc0143 [Agrobacterium genomosp. 2 str. CFBP 5494]
MRQHSDSSFIFDTTAHYLVAPAQGPQNDEPERWLPLASWNDPV